MEWIKRLWRKAKHPNYCCDKDDRVLLVTIGNLAFVKCRGCKAESIPWRVPAHKGAKWRSMNQDLREEFGV